jgi:hypothetical protein
MRTEEDEIRAALASLADNRPREEDVLAAVRAATGRTRHHQPRRLRRLAIAVCAAAAVIAAIVAPLTIVRSRTSGEPPVLSGCPAPAGRAVALANQAGRTSTDAEIRWSNSLRAGPAPGVPFTVTDEQGRGYLQDGTARVPLTAGRQVQVLGRLHCGWLLFRTDSKRCQNDAGEDGGEVGVLHPDGRFRELGRVSAGGRKTCAEGPGVPTGRPDAMVALSPDRDMVAFVAPGGLLGMRRSQLRVLSTDTGDQVAHRKVDEVAKVLSWNDHGIWYFDRTTTDTYRWKPGSDPQAISAVHGTAGLDGLIAFPGAERMIREDLNSRPNQTCAQVIEPDGDAFRMVIEHCKAGFGAGSLSPDGRLLVTLEHTYRVPGAPTPFRPIAHGLWTPVGVWESDTRTFVEARAKSTDGQPFGRQIVLRCDAVTAACTRVADLDNDARLRLGQR